MNPGTGVLRAWVEEGPGGYCKTPRGERRSRDLATKGGQLMRREEKSGLSKRKLGRPMTSPVFRASWERSAERPRKKKTEDSQAKKTPERG